MADAMAPFTGKPQLTAILEMAIDGACGPWSTPGTSAASSRSDCPRDGRSPRSISSLAYNPAMIVFPAPGSSASRNRSGMRGNSSPYTARI